MLSALVTGFGFGASKEVGTMKCKGCWFPAKVHGFQKVVVIKTMSFFGGSSGEQGLDKVKGSGSKQYDTVCVKHARPRQRKRQNLGEPPFHSPPGSLLNIHPASFLPENNHCLKEPFFILIDTNTLNIIVINVNTTIIV